MYSHINSFSFLSCSKLLFRKSLPTRTTKCFSHVSYNIIKALRFRLKYLTHLGTIGTCSRWETRNLLSLSCMWIFIFPTPFVKETVFSPVCVSVLLCTYKWMAVPVHVCFWVLYSVPLVYMSVLCQYHGAIMIIQQNGRSQTG